MIGASVKTASDRVSRERAIARNRAFVAEINATTVCAHCGAQPVEWHNPEHVLQGKNHRRISRLAGRTTAIATIQDEIDRCTPLCRRCHMAEDGRMENFLANRPRQAGTTFPAKPCSECGQPYKPLRRGLCMRCSNRKYYYEQTATGENAGAVRRRRYGVARIEVAS